MSKNFFEVKYLTDGETTPVTHEEEMFHSNNFHIMEICRISERFKQEKDMIVYPLKSLIIQIEIGH